ncbi:MAG: hypothetical protein HWN81_00420 [Candidatus Lokiarchaeota archaeon]|nr:hypothetical protein [Candidatus Lokiarchaeota archaeon]
MAIFEYDKDLDIKVGDIGTVCRETELAYIVKMDSGHKISVPKENARVLK